MLTFYPRDIGLWREYFSFNNPVTLTTKPKNDHIVLKDREELIEFIKGFGVKLDDYNYPLTIRETDMVRGGLPAQAVTCWTVVGYITEDFK